MTRQLLTLLKHLYLCADFFFFLTQKTEEGSIAMVGLQILAYKFLLTDATVELGCGLKVSDQDAGQG